MHLHYSYPDKPAPNAFSTPTIGTYRRVPGRPHSVANYPRRIQRRTPTPFGSKSTGPWFGLPTQPSTGLVSAGHPFEARTPSTPMMGPAILPWLDSTLPCCGVVLVRCRHMYPAPMFVLPVLKLCSGDSPSIFSQPCGQSPTGSASLGVVNAHRSLAGSSFATAPVQRCANAPTAGCSHQATAPSCVQFAARSPALLFCRHATQFVWAPGSLANPQAARSASPH